MTTDTRITCVTCKTDLADAEGGCLECSTVECECCGHQRPWDDAILDIDGSIICSECCDTPDLAQAVLQSAGVVA